MARSSNAVTGLAAQLGLGKRELVSLVGGGGKSTVMFGLGHELATAGSRVILTTTTKMGRDQTVGAPTVCWSADNDRVIAALDKPGPVMLLVGGDEHKVTGPLPEVVDRLYVESGADYVIVEADGSWQRPLKAHGPHEPVVPFTSTTVVILMGIEAVGRPLGDATHRVEQAQRFSGLTTTHRLTPIDCAEILVHPEGALRSCPPQARVLIGITKVRTEGEAAAAAAIARHLSSHSRIANCLRVSVE